jgi:mono/diheme cytochrome c family protein
MTRWLRRGFAYRVAGLCLLLLPLLASADDRRARFNYLLHCSGCHQADGTGSVGSGIPNMKDRVGHFLRIPEGRAFLIQVPGTSQSPLNDALTAELANWMVKAFSKAEIPAYFVHYSDVEVANLRAYPLSDAAGTRSDIARRLRAMGFEVD